jgi:hypothetical protein
MTMTDLQKAQDNLDRFLSDHPELISYQSEIDRILSNTPEHQRLEVLSLLMAERLQALSTKLQELSQCL